MIRVERHVYMKTVAYVNIRHVCQVQTETSSYSHQKVTYCSHDKAENDHLALNNSHSLLIAGGRSYNPTVR